MVTINQILGGFLMGEGLLSITFSVDKRGISQIGRFIRIGIGYYLYKIE